MYDIIIIGAGTAGLSSAIYALRAGKKVLVLEGKIHGGQIINSHEVENYPGLLKMNGVDYANNLLEHAKKFNVELKYERVLEIKNDVVITKDNSYNFKALIIATGTKYRKLGLPNEERFTGMGVSYCGFCDGNFYKDKVVAIVGGGNTAVEDANYLSKLANKVYLIHRGDKLRAEEGLINSLNDNVEIMYNSQVTNLNGTSKLDSIVVNDKEIEVAGLFIAIGQIPDTDIFKDIVDINEYGYIIAKEDCKTNVANIFVAGDVRTKDIRQLITAASDGAIAAIKAGEYLNK